MPKAAAFHRDVFPLEKRYSKTDKRGYSVQIVRCCECPKTEEVRVTNTRGLPPEPLIKRFNQMGWDCGSHRGRDTCPRCVARRREPNSTAVVLKPREWVTELEIIEQPEDLAIMAEPLPTTVIEPAPVPIIEEITVTAKPTLVAVTDEPRRPTREQNQRIRARLDEVYDEARQCYTRGGHTDQTVATGLGYPRTWISELRDQLYGPEGNEETFAAIEAMDKLRIDLGTATNQIVVQTDAQITAFRDDIARRIDAVIKVRDESIAALQRRFAELEKQHTRLLTSVK